jgi:hypothetical protein
VCGEKEEAKVNKRRGRKEMDMDVVCDQSFTACTRTYIHGSRARTRLGCSLLAGALELSYRG